MEFSKQKDRNDVKAAGSHLQTFPALKGIRIKADLNRDERDEYKRLYDLKDKLMEENPEKTVIIDKGVLTLDGEEVDRYKTPKTFFKSRIKRTNF